MNKKLNLNKKVLSTLDYDAMKKIQGGISVSDYCMSAVQISVEQTYNTKIYSEGAEVSNLGLRSASMEDTSINDGPDELWGSRLCGTYFKYGGCSGAGRSKSCSGTLICIPL
jgi:hypothetical protein